MTTTARAHEPAPDLSRPQERLWNGVPSLTSANELSGGSLIGHLGIEFIEVGDDYLIARMPVDDRTRQPLGVLHGGASVTLAETLASWAAIFTIDHDHTSCVGMEINANHIRPVTSGWVTGIASPIALGRTTQVWEVRITRSDGKLACISRCTMAVIPRRTHDGSPSNET
jgi:1,4-dihydroxy-2-naphthoyl-CoA hydrolase